MQRLSLIGVWFCWLISLLSAQSPHGNQLKINCSSCHSAESWKFENQLGFNHDSTDFQITGQHAKLDCKSCHTSLEFNLAPNQCISCHTDVHQQSLGMDCARCHSSNTWLVNNISELHERANFPLVGVHRTVDCNACHKSETQLRFEPLGLECKSCHQKDFDNTKSPDHRKNAYSDNCLDCHSQHSTGWKTGTINHDFFPLVNSHKIDDCRKCHESNDYSKATPDCFSCHALDFKNSINPNHPKAGISNDCKSCHSLDPDWKPAKFQEHDAQHFPIYSGKHQGVWQRCNDCHANGQDYKIFTCTNCHLNPEADQKHINVSGYQYENTACLSCHPSGEADNAFNHASTNFPLTGAHRSVECKLCHINGYKGTPTECQACHQKDYDASIDPSHKKLNLTTDCKTCHTTDAGWSPAKFDIHDQVFPLTGAHKSIENDCKKCHITSFNNTPNDCVGCHQKDYDASVDPSHKKLNLSTDCKTCHTTVAGWSPAKFDIQHDQVFPLTGAHKSIENDCKKCHINSFNNTPNDCIGCHQKDYDASVDPSHKKLNLSTDCKTCHTTDPGWSPARFDIHDMFFELKGVHKTIASDCRKCHISSFNNTPNTCVGCHQSDYDATKNPEHKTVGFTTECKQCHNEQGWIPSIFDHDGFYFPINSGKHKGTWTNCNECHTTPGNFKIYDCLNCHKNPETDDRHKSVTGYRYQNNACLACHPQGDADMSFDHNNTLFPLTGAHRSVDCFECHTSGFKGTPKECASCHQENFNATQNPSHTKLSLSTDCIQCHTTDPGWMPAKFEIHDQFYELKGAHSAVRNDCKTCHNGNYNNTRNTCFECHQKDYNESKNPDHKVVQFPTDCKSCHNENAWIPSTFNHDGMYFPIYSGKHKGVWNNCVECHLNPNDYKIITCIGCHKNPETDDQHSMVNGYTYNDQMCLACHPQGDASMKFDHNNTSFPLTGAHRVAACIECHSKGFKGTPTDCNSCHQSDYEGSLNPSHKKLNLSTDCISCHTTDPGWSPAKFEIHDNYYPLTGAHNPVRNNCALCHQGNYNQTGRDCYSCHQIQYDQSLNPEHKKLNLPKDCNQCHNTNPGWEPATFTIHDQFYELRGAHNLIRNDCNKCHANGNYNNTPNTCFGCHQKDYESTKNPDHKLSQFNTDCASCHKESSWIPSTFDHDGLYFPINSGKHKGVWSQCTECHIDPTKYEIFQCIGCHINPKTNEDHIGIGGYVYQDFACLACHPQGDAKMAYDHNLGGFPLTGAHILADCKDCHKTQFKGTSKECNSCHNLDYNNSLNPDHEVLNLSTECAMCHTTNPGWAPALFPIHDQFWTFTGAHIPVKDNCVKCHQGNYNNTPNTCVGCHQSDYNTSTNPNHKSLNIPTDCDQCHTTEPGWSPATFPIHDQYWPFTGAHIPVKDNCALCHKNGNYNNTPNTCVGCHLPQYNGSTNPNHKTLNIPTTCDNCHTTDPGWAPATFDIHDQYWMLKGAHLQIKNNCNACHNGNYNNTPNTCFGCHANDYNGANNPPHVSAGFPTTCASCHNETAWIPSSFDHDNMYFPIYSGKHKDEWNTCSQCHTNSSNYKIFTCLPCHPKPQTDSDHNGVQGYSYTSSACYSCHPDGKK